VSVGDVQVYGVVVSWSRWWWAAPLRLAAADDDLALPDPARRHPGRERAVDALAVLLAVALGALFLSPELHDTPQPLSATQIAVDVTAGLLACVSLWWRRRWPVGVAVACLLLGTVSTSATPAGLLALSSLAVHRPTRPTVIVTVLWLPSVLLFAVYSPTTDPVTVVAFVMPLALAASGWGMFLRARRQLLLSLQDRVLRAEADQELHQEQARLAERTRIAREMHDVLAHRISLIALHAGGLELRPDLPPDQIQQTAALLRATARQALEELRSVIGVLRDQTGPEPASAAPLPGLRDISRLVQETRDAGTDIDFEMRVEAMNDLPEPLGRDAYRIVQEALTNVSKHARGAPARVRVTGSPDDGLHISVRNPQPVPASTTPTLPGSGAGLLGLHERVALAGGTLTVGPDGSGDFVVQAALTWRG
jgi:signal transduction histidine kinase